MSHLKPIGIVVAVAIAVWIGVLPVASALNAHSPRSGHWSIRYWNRPKGHGGVSGVRPAANSVWIA